MKVTLNYTIKKCGYCGYCGQDEIHECKIMSTYDEKCNNSVKVTWKYKIGVW